MEWLVQSCNERLIWQAFLLYSDPAVIITGLTLLGCQRLWQQMFYYLLNCKCKRNRSGILRCLMGREGKSTEKSGLDLAVWARFTWLDYLREHPSPLRGLEDPAVQDDLVNQLGQQCLLLHVPLVNPGRKSKRVREFWYSRDNCWCFPRSRPAEETPVIEWYSSWKKGTHSVCVQVEKKAARTNLKISTVLIQYLF